MQRCRGIFPTFPITGLLTLKWPSKMLWWHRVLNRVFPWPPWCFLNVYELKKPASAVVVAATPALRPPQRRVRKPASVAEPV